MKRILICISASLMICGVSLAQNTYQHRVDGAKYSERKVNLDDDNTNGVTQVRAVAGNTQATTVYVPNVQSTPTMAATLLSNIMHDNIASENGINWTDAGITNSGVSWTDIQAAQKAFGLTGGVHWNYLETTTGGINWTGVIKGAGDGVILCAKGGQIGKCAAGFSSTSAGSCTCI